MGGCDESLALSRSSRCSRFRSVSQCGEPTSIVVAQLSPRRLTQSISRSCGTDPSGKRTTYSNALLARIAKATDVEPGRMP